jgi:S1-C subfamily serine protease
VGRSAGWRARWGIRGSVAFLLTAGILTAQATPTLPSAADINPVRPEQLAASLRAATVELVTLGCDLGTRQGTAVALGPLGFVTNRHVVDVARETELIPDLGPASRAKATEVSSLGTDLAVVRAFGPIPHALPLAPVDPLPGARVTMAGFPSGAHGIDISLAQVVDYVDGRPRGQPVQVMRLNAHVAPGMSGGPVVDLAGRVSGVIFGTESPSDYALALPVSAVRALLGRSAAQQSETC